MRILFPIILLFAAFIRPAQAFLDLPYVTPANPVAGEAISVNIYGGGCDLADIGVIWPPPVTQDGSDITISLTGIHETDPEWCYFNVGTETYSIGAYPAGSYTLYANRRYTSGSGVWIHETLGIIPFTVSVHYTKSTQCMNSNKRRLP